MAETASRITLPKLSAMKITGEKIAMLTAYDASFARVLDEAGVDVILVGDSLGMVIQGEATTLPVGLDAMVYHSRCVARATRRAWIIADLPFMTYASPDMAAQSAARLMQEGRAQMVKLEGGHTRVDVIRFLVDQGIPVCAHLGLLPQSIHQLGSYAVQATTDESAADLLDDALRVQDAGASMLVLECVPAHLARRVTEHVSIPVIGIGAGAACDGQVLVLHDMLGLGPARRFVKNFLAGAGDIPGAIRAYVEAVRTGTFPGPEHGF